MIQNLYLCFILQKILNNNHYNQLSIKNLLGKVLKFFAANMLPINLKKTNYMIITSPKKKTSIRITVCKKSQIKYLSVLIDDRVVTRYIFSSLIP